MAGVQRKLVHKQFNSPMGLYSQANVKATLNRELKAFGADGLEVDEENTKPLNLANSAVLRAVEEEEQQAKCVDFFPRARPSRSRQRETESPQASQSPHHALHNQLLDQIKTEYLSHQNDVIIDRDTVLRINRLSTCRQLLKRDHSWPPVEQDMPTVQSPQILSKTHSIDVLREKFNSPTRLVEPTTRAVRQRVQLEGFALKQKQQPKAFSSTQVARTRTPTEELEPVQSQTPKNKGFSAPETKAADLDIGLVAPKREYYEQLTQQRFNTPATAKPRTPVRPRLKRQSYSLDRGRSRKRAVALVGATELPPPKPRNGVSAGSCNGTPKVQRRSIKLATELKICYDTDDEEEPKVSRRHSPSAVIDLEAMPLPATPRQRAAATASNCLPNQASTVIDNLAIKQQQQQQLALALAASKSQPGSPLQLEASERIIPVTLSVETSRSLQPSPQQASAEQIYDDACNYLRQDQQQHPSTSMSHTDKDDATQSATFVSATTGIKLQRQESAPRLKTQSSLSLASSIPTPPPLPAPPAPPVLRPKVKLDEVDRQARRQGGVFCSSPEPKPDQAKQHEAHVEIAQLEAKYAHIQQSITEHLRQIDTYMENAKTALQRTVQATSTQPAPPAPPTPPPPPPKSEPLKPLNKSNELWDLFATQQSPVMSVESPLQAILRQIYCRAAGIQLAPKEQAALEPLQASVPAENVPIVERALEDLHRIAVALDSEEHELLNVQHKTTPTAAMAEHVVVEEEEQEQKQQEGQTEDTHSDADGQDFSLEFKHVSDVIANYEQLSAGKEQISQTQELEQSTEEGIKTNQNEQSSNIKKENDADSTARAVSSPVCPHSQSQVDDLPGSWCTVCGECRDSPRGWGKLNKADQWRFDNLHNEPLANYKSTYEIRSPYVSRQISWEETQQQQQLPEEQALPQRNMVEIVTSNTVASSEPLERQPSRSPRPFSPRKSAAPITDIAQRWTSPLVLQKTSNSPTATTAKAGFTHVPQLESHNIGLLVRTATEPLQLCMYASSSMLASTPPATPRCNSQPPPFEFLTQAESSANHEPKFKSLASTEDLSYTAREHSLNRSFDNVSPRPYIGIEGYKRVAWPPAHEERIVREFTPQPQTQSPAPGSGGYYPLQPAAQSAAQPAGSSAVPAQGPIYNNVQPRTQQQPQTQPQAQQHQHHQQPTQNVYGSNTNYASRGSTPATVAAPAATAVQVPANNSSYTQQPVQYTQAQFGRQRSREPVQAPATAADNYAQYPQQHVQQQLPYQSDYPQQQQPSHNVDQFGVGWKHIGAPQPKTRSDFGVGGAAPAAAYPYQQQQQYLPQQQQQYQQQQQQYRAPSQDNYLQQQQQAPAPQHWQQQQQVQQQQQPQQHLPQSQLNQQARYQTSPYQQQQQPQQQQQLQQQPNYAQQNDAANYAQPQYNSYSQPQQQLLPQQQQQLPYSQDQTDQQHSYRDASPGIITLRKETPVSQQPAPVYTSQPAAVSYQGGSKLRGDLKWPPPEYKEAAVRENEERRLLALGPVCRPRRVNRDYSNFFAQHQLNCAYPSYKVPPGTQHMFA